MYKIFALFFAVGFGITLASGYYIGFHAAGIDFWTVLYYGRHMNAAEPASLYNGFYPFGYAFLIGQLPFTYALQLSYLLNALLTGLFTASVSTLVFASRSYFATLVAFIVSVVASTVYVNANTLGPDIGSVAFTAFAVFFLWRNHFASPTTEVTSAESIMVGASLGIAALFRSHAIVSSIAILLSYFLVAGVRPLRSRGLMVGAFLIICALQVAINLVSGHGAFETAQAFNIYKFFYGVGWTISPTPLELKDFSLIETVMSDPGPALDSYFYVFRYYLINNWIIAALFLLAPKGRTSRYALFSMIFVVIYAIPVSWSDSARGLILLMGAYVTSVGLSVVAITDTINNVWPSRKWAANIILALFAILLVPSIYQWARQDLDFLRANRGEQNILLNVEQVLLKHDMKDPDQVFADRYDFYTPNLMPYRSRLIGNWSGDWIWGFGDEYPILPNDSWESFVEACKAQGIRFLVLSPNSFYRGDFFPPIYHGEVDIDQLGLIFIGQRGKMRIYEIQ